MRDLTTLHHTRSARRLSLTTCLLGLPCGMVLLLMPVAAQADAEAKDGKPPSAATLPTVEVKASTAHESPTGAVQGYAARRTGSATKTDTAVLESPQSISIVGQEQMQAQGADSILSSLRYTAGVAPGNSDADIWESFYLRGFKVRRARRDGMVYQADAWDGRQEPFGIERVEVLKGPSSVIFGGDEPGGQINTVSKQPAPDSVRQIQIEGGSHGRRMLGFDIGGPANARDASQGGTQATAHYRVVGVLRNQGSWITSVRSRRAYLAPSWSWTPNARTQLTLLSEFQHDNAIPLEYGVPADAVLKPNPHGRVSRGFFAGEPGFDKVNIRRASIGYRLRHDFQPSLTLHHALRYLDVATDLRYTNIGRVQADQRTLTRPMGMDMKRASRQWVTDTYLLRKWQSPGVQHQTLVGFDFSTDRLSALRKEVPIVSGGDLDLFNPVYGRAVFGTPVARPHRGLRHSMLTQFGVYAQEQMKIQNRWAVTLGMRYGWARWGDKPYDKSRPYDTSKAQALTGRAGVVYLADGGWAPYVSWSQSFAPQGGVDRHGRRFSPTRGEQFEVGLRYQPPGRDMLLSASLYHLSKTHVLTPDPTDRDFKVQTGKVVVKGLELEAQTRLSRNLGLIAGYGYTDARIAASNTPQEVGNRFDDIPRHQLSLWTDYRMAALGLPGWTVGLGVRHTGTNLSRGRTVPGYTVLDAMLSYRSGPWQARLNVRNLTDRKYVESCAYACFFGQPLSAQLNVNYLF